MRMIIVGSGYMARVHASALRAIEGVEVVAIAGRNAQKVSALAAEFDIPRVYADWREAFAAGGADAALICLPHALHYPCAIDALRSGLHLFIEKPLAISTDEVREIVQLATETGRTVMGGHMKRFDRRFTTMKGQIDAGGIGAPFLVKSEWIGAREIIPSIPWVADPRGGGGPLMGFGSHHIDLLRWMVGPIARVSCSVSHQAVSDIEIEDTAVATVEFENGVLGSLIYTWGAEIEGQYESLVIYGTRGTLKLENEELSYTSEKVYGDRIPRSLDVKRADTRDINEFGKELALSSLEPFTLELKHFIDCVTNNTTPCIDAREASQTVEVINQAYRSAGVSYLNEQAYTYSGGSDNKDVKGS